LKALVTGAAGFIGSHLVEELLRQGWYVKGVDNLSGGRIENLQGNLSNSKLKFIHMDLRYLSKVVEICEGVDVVFHLAADPDVRTSTLNPSSHLSNNVTPTFNVLEAMRLNDVNRFVFASSSTVYGDAEIIPTSEDYSSMRPISVYGATKLACEALICGYVNSFDMRALIVRPANIVGSRSTHGVLIDFINKLRANPSVLKILGDGKQKKSYLHISDCIRAMLMAYSHYEASSSKMEIYNIGNEDSTEVLEIARIVMDEMGLDADIRPTGGVEGGRGWKGDVKTMLLSIDALKKIGWHPKYNSAKAIRVATRQLLT